jgi:hypothetical protein
MSYLERARKIAFLSLYLKDEFRGLSKDELDRLSRLAGTPKAKRTRRGSGGKLSDGQLAILLNEAHAEHERRVTFDGKKINDIVHAKTLGLAAKEQDEILDAFQALIDQYALPISTEGGLPSWIEDRYSTELPEIFRQREPPPPAGEPLGQLAISLPGAWHFFYIRPVDEEGEQNPEIRHLVAVFGRARPDSTWMSFLLISSEHHYRGYSFAHEYHVYTVCTEERRTESAFFILNKPALRDNYMFAGVGTALIQPPRRHEPVAGIVCFGMRIGPETALSDEQKEAIRLAMESDRLSKENENNLRKAITQTRYVKVDDLRRDYPDLVKYVESIEVDGEQKFPLQASLRLRWVDPKEKRK